MRMVQPQLSNLTTREQVVQGYRQMFGSYISQSKIIIYPTPFKITADKNQKLNQIKYLKLLRDEWRLQKQIEQAKGEHTKMLDLFNSLLKIESGETRLNKKGQRRCSSDILVKYACQYNDCGKTYSSEDCLLRHVKVKHGSSKNKPPELYYDLHPEPNLTHIYFQTSEEESKDIREKTLPIPNSTNHQSQQMI